MACSWINLVWVVFTDVYIYLVPSGAIRDPSTWVKKGDRRPDEPFFTCLAHYLLGVLPCA